MQLASSGRLGVVWRAVAAAVLAVGAAAGCTRPPEPAPPPPGPRALVAAQPAVSASPSSPATIAPAPPSAPPPDCPPLTVEPPPLPEELSEVPVPRFVDPEQRALAPFYDSLARQLRGKLERPIRIAFYGDSNLTLDVLSGTLRRVLQERFGDAGHGYVGVGSPFRGYRHLDVRRRMVGTWRTHLYSHHTRGDRFGAGGMAASTAEPNARAVFRTAAADAPVGRHASRFTVFYLKQPRGGSFSVAADKQEPLVVETEAAERQLGVATVRVDDGPHRFVVTNLTTRWIRLFGVTLERDRPGIIVDSFGVTGTTYFHLARMDEAISREMLAQRGYDLVLFLVGTNFWRFEQNPQSAAAVVRLHRTVRPGLPVVIMSPPDHVRSKHSRHSDPRVVKVSQQLQQIAAAEGCAFWSFREAMGGDGAMRKFYYQGLAGADLYHLTDRGAATMGDRLAYALLRGLGDYLKRRPQAGCAGRRIDSSQRQSRSPLSDPVRDG